MHRYLFAREFVAGRRVLDIGGGAGAALLAETAAHVTVVSASANELPAGGILPANLEFLPGEAARLPLPDQAVEVVLFLAGLGPTDGQAAVLHEVRRVLRAGGVLIAANDPPADASNFEAMLRKHFTQIALAKQSPVRGSGLFFGAAAARNFASNCISEAEGPPAISGLLAIASDAELPPLFDGICTAAGSDGQVEELSRELASLRDSLAEQEARVQAMSARLEIERQRSNAIESSTIWRASQPLRRVLSKFPGLRQTIRQGLRRVYRSRNMLRHRRIRRRLQQDYEPLVSVIVPNFNHARFLPQRIESILGQSYGNIEVIVLDDASTDDSVAVIEGFRAANPDIIRVIANERNSGNVFRQWRRGVAEAKGELIWICESDDFAEPDFLQELVPVFLDESVMIGFGRIQFADVDGKPYAGLDAYRERSQPGIWKSRNIRSAKAWFDTAFGVHNVIPNVGGCLLRNQPIEEEVWEEAATYRILGDWYLYAMLARGGRLAYEPGAVTYFRQHGGNTSVASFDTAPYYVEHERIIRLLRMRWGVPETTVRRFAEELRAQFRRAGGTAALGALETVFDEERVLATPREGRHVLMVILGFYLGGGEIFPIHLANELVRQGVTVSVMTLLPHDWNIGIRAQLDRRVAVYDAALVRRQGVRRFIAEAGVDVIHSHFVGAEGFFFYEGYETPDVPYLATLHGSYEATAVSTGFVEKAAQNVSLWVYLTDKNLDHLQVLGCEERARIATLRVPNGMPLDPRPFGQSRAELGIGDHDLVFALASRAIREKGWEVAINALLLAQRRTDRPLHLLLCGTGPEADRLRAIHGRTPGVMFLGFQDRVPGLYRLADCAILPTRFHGESFPLALVQAMQVGKPIIATDVGEISRMLIQGELAAGIVIPPEPDDALFAEQLAEAMLAMMDDEARIGFGRDAAVLGEAYGMEKVAAAYIANYDGVIARHGQ
ncbi:MAG: glycosyltransferase [Rubritepida sp.]|nr:glycosyltransferase [Rubritepida sp.]